MRDELEGLSEYLDAFASDDRFSGVAPARGFALAGFGAAAGGAGWDTEAIGRKPSAALLQSKFNCKQRCTERYNEWTPYQIIDISRDLIALQAMKGPPSKSWSQVQAGWKTYANTFKVYPEAEPASGGTYSSEFVWINKLARAKLAKDAAAAGPTTQTTTKPTAPTPKPAGGYVASTAAVQDVLIRLGWRGKGTTSGSISKALTDGLYGPTVVANWQQSANKRKLDPSIAKASADGRQVVVNENTFLSLKAVADTLVPPTQEPKAPSSLWSLGDKVITSVTVDRLGEVLGRISGATQNAAVDLTALYEKITKARNLDSRIEPSADRKSVAVVKTTWNALLKEFDQKAPAPPPPTPAEKSDVERAMGVIEQAATVTVPSKTLRAYFNIAIKQGVLKRETFASEKWTADYAPLLIAMRQVDGPAKKAWEQLLVPGKLVAKDLTSVKLPADQATSIKKKVDEYAAAQRAETERIQGFTKVNTATVIEAINKLGVSTKQFNTSGGYSELVDAVKTFYENTKRPLPSGDLVKTVAATKEVFVNDAALKALADEKQKAEERKSATEKYRKNMVAEALKSSSATVSVDDVQRAFIETVHAGLAGRNKDLYAAVRRNGSFDSPTRAAYTELASVKTIGPAVLEFQRLLVAQRGSGDAKLVRKVQNDVWDEFLKQAASKKDGKNVIRVLPAIARDIEAAASAYKKRVSTERDDAAKRAEADKLLAETVKKSNVIVSIFDVQQGLLWAALKKEIAKQLSLKITGRADEATKVALFELSGKIFPSSIDRKKWSWDEYLDKVGIRVESATSVKMGWNGANYVALPQAAADYLAGRAELWMGRYGAPSGRSDLAPVPLSNQTLLLNIDKPTVITVKVKPADKLDAKKDDEKRKRDAEEREARRRRAQKKAEDAKKKAAAAKKKAGEAAAKAAKKKKEADAAAELAAKNKADQAAQEAAARAKVEADAAAAEANRLALEAAAAKNTEAQAAQEAAGGAGGAGEGGQAAGGQAQAQGGSVGPISITIPGGGGFAPPAPEPMPGPEPTAPPTPEPTPVEPMQAGMFSPGAFMFMTAAGLGFMLFGGDKDKKKAASGRYPRRTADARSRTRYSR